MMLLTDKMTAPLLVLSVLLGAAGVTQASEFQLKPALALSEEYNDNILESATAQRSDFITRVRPGATLLYKAPSLTADVAYNFEYLNYARATKTDEMNNRLLLHASAAVTEKFFFIDVSDSLSRVSVSVVRDVTTESTFLNQTDQNVATVAPYLVWHLGEKTQLKTGYRFTDTRYWSAVGVDKQEHRVSADLTHEYSSRLSFTAGYAFSKVDSDLIRYDEHDVSSGVRYEYADKSFLFGGIGNSWLVFPGSRHASNLFWNAGITNDFGFVVGSLETRVQYTEDPLTGTPTKQTSYSAGVNKTFQHGTFGLTGSYSDYAATAVDAAIQQPNQQPNQHKRALTGFGHYEFSPRLSTNVSATADRVTGGNDFPYHFNGSAGVSYGFNYDITASLTYTRVEYRRAWDSATGARQTDRAVLELTKVF